MLLENKVCVIVGAGSLRGIGYATAELFAEHGAKIVAVDVVMNDGLASEIKASIDRKTGRDADVIGIRCDIADEEDCTRLFDGVIARFGTVDCLVNSAAIVKAQPMLTIDGSDFDRMMNVNLKGAFNLCKSALAVFAE
jgi:NAD(P)-dependent dehydrogenase (short-subunit alcohol dehydrogenase family)